MAEPADHEPLCGNYPITFDELYELCEETKKKFRSSHPRDNDTYPEQVCDEVYDGIFIGNPNTVRDRKSYLHDLGITHIVNTVPEFDLHSDASPSEFKILRWKELDGLVDYVPNRFFKSNEFIHDALQEGKVFITSLQWERANRDFIIVVAYLMIKRNIEPAEAIRRIGGICELILSEDQIYEIALLDEYLLELKMQNIRNEGTNSYCCLS